MRIVVGVPLSNSGKKQVYRITVHTISSGRADVLVEAPSRRKARNFVRYQLRPRSHVQKVNRVSGSKSIEEDRTIHEIGDENSGASTDSPQPPAA